MDKEWARDSGAGELDVLQKNLVTTFLGRT